MSYELINTKLDLQKRFKFFFKHSGWATPPGKAACALSSAKAEIAAEERNWTYDWSHDEDPDRSWEEDAGYQGPGEYFICQLLDGEGDTLEVLGGIVDPDDNYRRVIAAELAGEALLHTDAGDPEPEPLKHNLSGEQLATVLAALRFWQDHFSQPDPTKGMPHFDDHEPLTDDEIDKLCEQLNC